MVGLFHLAILLSPLPAGTGTLSPDEKEDFRNVEYWDCIGIFGLVDGEKNQFLVKLYSVNSDVIAEKVAEKTGFYSAQFPNRHEIHAVYLSAKGWAHKKVCSGTRARCLGAEKSTPKEVTLKLRTWIQVFGGPDESIADLMARAEKINRPFDLRLRIENGSPTIVDRVAPK